MLRCFTLARLAGFSNDAGRLPQVVGKYALTYLYVGSIADFS